MLQQDTLLSLDPDDLSDNWYREFVNRYIAGYGGARCPVTPIPVELPEQEQRAGFLKWAAASVKSGSIVAVPPGSNRDSAMKSMGLARNTIYDGLTGASLLIIEWKAKFYTSLVELYKLSQSMTDTEFCYGYDARVISAFEKTVQSYMWLTAVAESTPDTVERPVWIDHKETLFILYCISIFSEKM